jgi:hypothetical protein
MFDLFIVEWFVTKLGNVNLTTCEIIAQPFSTTRLLGFSVNYIIIERGD